MKDWFKKNNNSSASDFDLDVDRDYYDNATDSVDSYEADDIYGEEFGGFGSDITVVEPEEPEEEPLYKVLYAPEDCQDSRDIVDSLIAGRVVVMNVAGLDRENFLRLFDYIMGALHVLGGDMKKFGKKVVALFPAGVDVDTPLDEIEDEPYEEADEEIDEEI